MKSCTQISGESKMSDPRKTVQNHLKNMRALPREQLFEATENWTRNEPATVPGGERPAGGKPVQQSFDLGGKRRVVGRPGEVRWRSKCSGRQGIAHDGGMTVASISWIHLIHFLVLPGQRPYLARPGEVSLKPTL